MTPTRSTRTAGHVLLAATLLTGVGACADGGQARPDAAPATTAQQPRAAAYPAKVDDCGKEVTVDAAPKRVLTVGSAAVSLLDAAGASDRIAARSAEFGAALPTGVTAPPTSATVIDPDDPGTEAILDADVDAVYGYGLFKAKAADLTKAGITLLTVQGECGHDAGDSGARTTLATIADDIRRLGAVFGTTGHADSAASTFEAEAAKLTSATKDRGGAAWVYYFGPTDSLSAYGGKRIAADLLGRAGLTNVFDAQKPYFDTNVEALLAEDPEWIVLSYGLYGESAADAEKKFRSEPGAGQLQAVKKGHLVMVPGEASHPSPVALDGLRDIVKAVSSS